MSDELVSVAARMAGQLQSLSDAARESGSPMKDVESLIKEFNDWRRLNRSWQSALVGSKESSDVKLSFLVGDE